MSSMACLRAARPQSADLHVLSAGATHSLRRSRHCTLRIHVFLFEDITLMHGDVRRCVLNYPRIYSLCCGGMLLSSSVLQSTTCLYQRLSGTSNLSTVDSLILSKTKEKSRVAGAAVTSVRRIATRNLTTVRSTTRRKGARSSSKPTPW